MIIIIGVIPLSFVQEAHTEQPEESNATSIFQFAPKAPMLLIVVGTFAIFDAGTLALLPVYGLQNGLSLSTAATMLTALTIGNVVLQFPLGWLADKYPHRLVLTSCALFTAVGLLLLPAAMGTLWMWVILVLVGTSGYGVYTVSLISLGDRFEGQELVNGSAAFAVMWGSGALLGSISGGWSMNLFGPHGLPVYLAVIYFLLVLGLLVRGRYL